MERSIILAGFGGQGLLFAGQILARAATAEGSQVLWIPSYGPEMRGGTASCTVIVSDREIGSPIVDRVDVAMVLNPPSLAKYERLLAREGLLVLNSTLIEAEPSRSDIEIVPVPCTALARAAADERLTSIAGLGATLARRRLVDPASVRAALREVLAVKQPTVLEANLASFAAGYDAALPVGV
jgi:2-oxoglutarate ferredoxin oxidoreductase subunit gamma